MNAKKIMGAVLVALLAAALFVGAGAAADNSVVVVNMGTVFLYQDVTGTGLTGTWSDGDQSVSIINGIVTPGEKFTNGGTYIQGSNAITVKKADAVITASAEDANGKKYAVIGKTLFKGYQSVDFVFESDATIAGTPGTPAVAAYIITLPSGIPMRVLESQIDSYSFTETGEYKIVPVFGNTGFVDTVTSEFLTGSEYTFNVASADAEIKLASDTVITNDVVKLTVTGVPGESYVLDFNSGFILTPNQPSGINSLSFAMPNSGMVDFYIQALTVTGEYTISVKKAGATDLDATVDVEIIDGEITVKADKDAYFVGEDIELTGTSTGAGKLVFYIEGANIPFQIITDGKATPTEISASVKADDTWKQEFTYADLKAAVGKKLDAGTYSIYVSADVRVTADEASDLDYYEVVSVPLKQPFLTADLKTSIVAQGEKLEVTGTAESAGQVMYYIFGSNFFHNATQGVKASDSSFKIQVPIPTTMDAGQYFVVVQHPMYDGNFNIAPNYLAAKKGIIALNTTADVTKEGGETLFDVYDRQTANAAEALCQALDTENIDDIYVKASFIVAAPTATMNPIPSEVAKGTKIVVSGTTNLAPGSVITVEMLSTAFTAVPKADVNAASFIALTTKVADDGTWEVTFDTTGLNIDEYTITATAGQFVSTAKVNVVEKAPVTPEQPDTPVTPEQPEQPEQPTEPETPGFGALAALAGLGAVAVLLLRRE